VTFAPGRGYSGWMVALRKHLPTRMTVDEFLAWEPGDAACGWQLIDGEPVAMAPGNQTHGALQSELGALIRNHLLERRSACRVLTEPGVVPRVRAGYNYRVPDLGVTCAPPSLSQMMPEPVLLIELLSPGNEAQTRTNIWAYISIPSVVEILAVHTARIEAELLRRGADGSWPEQPQILGRDAMLTLESIGFSVPLAAAYRTTVLAVG